MSAPTAACSPPRATTPRAPASPRSCPSERSRSFGPHFVVTGAHRSTVARRIAKARDELFEGTRRVLAERFKLTGAELNSLIVLVKSDFDVSLEEALVQSNVPSPGMQ